MGDWYEERVARDKVQLLLASGSPRRREMISQLGISFAVFSPEVNEASHLGEPPPSYVERITRAKMDAARAYSDTSFCDFRAILTADTAVVLGNRILGKPASDEESLDMISSLSGQTHQVLSCYCLRDLSTGESRLRRVSTEVIFRDLLPEEVSAYVAEGEGRDKAGAYAIQGRAAGFVRAIHGSYSSVVGLPLSELVEDLRGLGILGRRS